MNTITDFIEAVWFRRRLVATTTIIVLLAALIYLVLAPKTYSASASLFFNEATPDPIPHSDGEPDASGSRNLSTEADIIRSLTITQQVIEKNGLADREEFREKWQATSPEADYTVWLPQYVLESVSIEADDENRVLKIHVNAEDAALAARMANGFASAFLDYELEATRGPARAYAKWLSKQLEDAKTEVANAETELREFVSITGISNRGDLNSEAAEAATIGAQLAIARAEMAASQQGAAALQGVADAELTQSIQNLRTQISERSAEISQMQSSYGPNHPRMKAAEAELKTLQSRLARERSTSVQAFTQSRNEALASARAAASARAGRLSGASASQRGRLLTMSKNLGKHEILQQNLANAQQRYGALQDRHKQMELRGAIPQSNVSQLDEAFAPLTPSSPKIGLILPLSLLLGLLIGGAFALYLEFRRPRVRSLGSIERLIGAPVVAHLALPKPTVRALIGPGRV